MLPMMVALAGVTLALGAMPLPATAAGLPLAGEMRKLTLPAEQKPVAAAEFQDEKGQPTSLAAFRGKVVLLNLWARSEEHTSELQSLMRISYAVFCLKKKKKKKRRKNRSTYENRTHQTRNYMQT